MKTVLLTGGTGLIGAELTKQLVARGYKIKMLTRNRSLKSQGNVDYIFWNVEEGIIDKEAVVLCDYIIHLAGANVTEKRWTDKRKQEIVDSRVKSGILLCNTLKNTNNNVKKIISASAIGWYGADPVIPNPYPFTEDAPHANDFLGRTCSQWEHSMYPVRDEKIPLVLLRTGIVLSNRGGALKEFLKPLKFGLAPVLGSGRQIISWIHIDDLVQLYIDIMEGDHEGVYNAVAPEPVSNHHLIDELAKAVKGKHYLKMKVSETILKIGMGEMSIEILKSTTVSCSKLQNKGFVFLYPTIHAALRQIAKSL